MAMYKKAGSLIFGKKIVLVFWIIITFTRINYYF